MRATLLTGGVLTVAAVAIVLLSTGLGLDVESVALMGAASGAVIALVPHRTPQARLIWFTVGFVASWLGYLLRAGALPDTAAGHSIAVALVVLVCTATAGFSRNRVPLWSTLLGAATMSGSYEATYLLAPSQVLSTSTTSSTSVLLAVALGFFAAALVALGGETSDQTPQPVPEKPAAAPAHRESALGNLMKEDAR